MDDSLPFDFWLVKINEKTQSTARGSQIVKALGRVFAGKTLHTFQFDHQHVVHKDVSKVLAGDRALVRYRK